MAVDCYVRAETRARMLDAWIVATAIVDAYAPDAPPATVSPESEATLEWLRAEDVSRRERPRTAADDAADEVRRYNAEREAAGVRTGWRDPSDPKNRAAAWPEPGEPKGPAYDG